MTSLLALLSQQTPSLQTRKGLILTGLQHDFLSPNGKLPLHTIDFTEKIRALVSNFRHYGNVIWVRSVFDADRNHQAADEGDADVVALLQCVLNCKGAKEWKSRSMKAMRSSGDLNGRCSVQDLDDEELFLAKTAHREPCCIPGTKGADFSHQIADLVHERDFKLVTTGYSAFGSTSLLSTLRSRLITELYVGGDMTNVSVFATAMDAARYGIKITLVEDCLGYRTKERHDAAIQSLRDLMGAHVMTADEVLKHLERPRCALQGPDCENSESEDGDAPAGSSQNSSEVDSSASWDEEDEGAKETQKSTTKVRSSRMRVRSRQCDNYDTSAATPKSPGDPARSPPKLLRVPLSIRNLRALEVTQTSESMAFVEENFARTRLKETDTTSSASSVGPTYLADAG